MTIYSAFPSPNANVSDIRVLKFRKAKNHSLMNTTIIISNLLPQDFISQANKLPLVDQIKLDVLNVDKHNDEDYFLNKITYWSNLPFLHRIVIILKDESISKELFEFLESLKLREGIKINLQENLLKRSKSNDNLQDNLFYDLKKFKNKNLGYEEPEPKKFDDSDLSKLGLLTDSSIEPPHDIKRSRSLTRTLYSPLTINTNLKHETSIPSPTITLDESEN